jgi:hypothetical protein
LNRPGISLNAFVSVATQLKSEQRLAAWNDDPCFRQHLLDLGFSGVLLEISCICFFRIRFSAKPRP